MQPLQYDLRDPAAKDNSITNAATARSNLDAAITMRSAETELQNTIELRATASEIVAPKPDRRQSEKKTILKFWSTFLKGFLEGKPLASKWRKSANKSMSQPSCSHSNTIYEIQLQKTIVLRMQPQHAATLTQPSAEIEFQNPIDLRATASEIVAPKPDGSRRQGEKKTILKHFLKGFLKGNSLAPKWRKSADKITVAAFMQPLLYDLRDPAAKDNSITNAATARSNLDAAIYTAGTILQLQSTMDFHRQLLHEHHLQSHLQWGNDPRVANHNGIPSATHPPAPLAIPFTLQERSYSCKSQWNSVDHKCTKHRWHPIYNAEPIRPWSENIRPWSDHTRDRLATVAPQR